MRLTLVSSEQSPGHAARTTRRRGAGGFTSTAPFALALALALGCGPADADRGTAARVPASGAACDALECQLAFIEVGHRVTSGYPLVARMRAHLDRLSADYPESRQQIADMTVNVQNSLRQQGLHESLDRLFTGFTTIPHPQPRYPAYQEVGALYLALRSQGFAHDSATAGLGAMVSRLGELR